MIIYNNLLRKIKKKKFSNNFFLTSSVFAVTVIGVSIRLEKLALLPCRLFLFKQLISGTSPAAILAILSFSMHCDSDIPNTRPPATSANNKIGKKKFI